MSSFLVITGMVERWQRQHQHTVRPETKRNDADNTAVVIAEPKT